MRKDLKKLRKKARDFKEKNRQPEEGGIGEESERVATNDMCRSTTQDSSINEKILNEIPTGITGYSLRKGIKKKGEDFSHLPTERSAQLAYACSLKPKTSA
jgi:hypothetical protein